MALSIRRRMGAQDDEEDQPQLPVNTPPVDAAPPWMSVQSPDAQARNDRVVPLDTVYGPLAAGMRRGGDQSDAFGDRDIPRPVEGPAGPAPTQAINPSLTENYIARYPKGQDPTTDTALSPEVRQGIIARREAEASGYKPGGVLAGYYGKTRTPKFGPQGSDPQTAEQLRSLAAPVKAVGDQFSNLGENARAGLEHLSNLAPGRPGVPGETMYERRVRRAKDVTGAAGRALGIAAAPYSAIADVGERAIVASDPTLRARADELERQGSTSAAAQVLAELHQTATDRASDHSLSQTDRDDATKISVILAGLRFGEFGGPQALKALAKAGIKNQLAFEARAKIKETAGEAKFQAGIDGDLSPRHQRVIAGLERKAAATTFPEEARSLREKVAELRANPNDPEALVNAERLAQGAGPRLSLDSPRYGFDAQGRPYGINAERAAAEADPGRVPIGTIPTPENVPPWAAQEAGPGAGSAPPVAADRAYGGKPTPDLRFVSDEQATSLHARLNPARSLQPHQEPPLAPDSVRLYRAETPRTRAPSTEAGATGRYFTADRSTADVYAARGGGLHFVDVPKAEAAKYATPGPNMRGQYVLPPEVANLKQSMSAPAAPRPGGLLNHEQFAASIGAVTPKQRAFVAQQLRDIEARTERARKVAEQGGSYGKKGGDPSQPSLFNVPESQQQPSSDLNLQNPEVSPEAARRAEPTGQQMELPGVPARPAPQFPGARQAGSPSLFTDESGLPLWAQKEAGGPAAAATTPRDPAMEARLAQRTTLTPEQRAEAAAPMPGAKARRASQDVSLAADAGRAELRAERGTITPKGTIEAGRMAYDSAKKNDPKLTALIDSGNWMGVSSHIATRSGTSADAMVQELQAFVYARERGVPAATAYLEKKRADEAKRADRYIVEKRPSTNGLGPPMDFVVDTQTGSAVNYGKKARELAADWNAHPENAAHWPLDKEEIPRNPHPGATENDATRTPAELLEKYQDDVRKMVRGAIGRLMGHSVQAADMEEFEQVGLTAFWKGLTTWNGDTDAPLPGALRLQVVGAAIDELRSRDVATRAEREAIKTSGVTPSHLMQPRSLDELLTETLPGAMPGMNVPGSGLRGRSGPLWDAIKPALGMLDDTTRQIVVDIFDKQLTQKEVGGKQGLDASGISRRIKKATEQLKTIMRAEIRTAHESDRALTRENIEQADGVELATGSRDRLTLREVERRLGLSRSRAMADLQRAGMDPPEVQAARARVQGRPQSFENRSPEAIAERAATVERLATAALNDVNQGFDHKMVFVTGFGGIGKSAREQQIIAEGFAHPNADDYAVEISGYDTGPDRPLLQDEAKWIARRVRDHLVANGANLLVQATGSNYAEMKQLVAQAFANGYTVRYEVVHGSRADAAAGAIKRLHDRNWFTDPLAAFEAQNPMDTFVQLRQIYPDLTAASPDRSVSVRGESYAYTRGTSEGQYVPLNVPHAPAAGPGAATKGSTPGGFDRSAGGGLDGQRSDGLAQDGAARAAGGGEGQGYPADARAVELAAKYGFPDAQSAGRAIQTFRANDRAAQQVEHPEAIAVTGLGRSAEREGAGVQIPLSASDRASVARMPRPTQERILGELENAGKPVRSPDEIVPEIKALDAQIHDLTVRSRAIGKMRERRVYDKKKQQIERKGLSGKTAAQNWNAQIGRLIDDRDVLQREYERSKNLYQFNAHTAIAADVGDPMAPLSSGAEHQTKAATAALMDAHVLPEGMVPHIADPVGANRRERAAIRSVQQLREKVAANFDDHIQKLVERLTTATGGDKEPTIAAVTAAVKRQADKLEATIPRLTTKKGVRSKQTVEYRRAYERDVQPLEAMHDRLTENMKKVRAAEGELKAMQVPIEKQLRDFVKTREWFYEVGVGDHTQEWIDAFDFAGDDLPRQRELLTQLNDIIAARDIEESKPGPPVGVPKFTLADPDEVARVEAVRDGLLEELRSDILVAKDEYGVDAAIADPAAASIKDVIDSLEDMKNAMLAIEAPETPPAKRSTADEQVLARMSLNTDHIQDPLVVNALAAEARAHPERYEQATAPMPFAEQAARTESLSGIVGKSPEEVLAFARRIAPGRGELVSLFRIMDNTLTEATWELHRLATAGQSKGPLWDKAYANWSALVETLGGGVSEAARATGARRVDVVAVAHQSAQTLEQARMRFADADSKWKNALIEAERTAERAAKLQGATNPISRAQAARAAQLADQAQLKLEQWTTAKDKLEYARGIAEQRAFAARKKYLADQTMKLAKKGRASPDLIRIISMLDPDKDFREITNILRNLDKVTRGDQVVAYAMNNMFSGLKNNEANDIGNALQVGFRTLSNIVVARTLSPLEARITGREQGILPIEGKYAMLAFKRSFPRALQTFVKVMKEGRGAVDILDEVPTANKYEMGSPDIFKGRWGILLEPALRHLSGADAAFFHLSFQMSQDARYARQAWLDGARTDAEIASKMADYLIFPPGDITKAAGEDAAQATYRGELDKLTDGMVRIAGIRFGPGQANGPWLKLFFSPIMFVANAMKYSIEASGGGMVRGPYLLWRAGKFTGEDAVNMRRTGLISTSLGILGGLLMADAIRSYLDDELTGDGPYDRTAQAEWLQTHKPRSRLVNGEWRSYEDFWPVSAAYHYVALIGDAIKAGVLAEDEVPALVWRGAAAFGKAFVDVPFVRRLHDYYDVFDEGRKYGPGTAAIRAAADLAKKFIPDTSFLRDLASFLDPTERDPKTFIERIESALPILSTNVRPRDNRWGEPVERTRGRGLGALVIGTGLGDTVNDDPVDAEVQRLERLTGANGKPLLDRVGFTSSTLGTVKLTPDEAERYQHVAGNLAHQYISQLMAGKSWSGLSDAEKAKRIQKAVDNGRSGGKLQLAGEMIREPDPAKKGTALSIYLSAADSNYQKAQWIDQWGKSFLDSDSELQKQFNLATATSRITYNDYKAAWPVLEQLRKMPEFANARGDAIGDEKIWKQYHEQSKIYNALVSDGKKQEAASYLANREHLILQEYRRYIPKNPQATRLTKDFDAERVKNGQAAIMSHFTIPRDDPD